MPKVPWCIYICMSVCLSIRLSVVNCVCVCSNISSETTGPIEAKFHVEPPWDRGRKFIQMVQVIIVNLLGVGAFCRDFTINESPQCRAFSRALKTEKLKTLLFPGPMGAGTTNDWCLINEFSPFAIPNHFSLISMSMQSWKKIVQKLLKLESGNDIFTSIKGHNSVV